MAVTWQEVKAALNPLVKFGFDIDPVFTTLESNLKCPDNSGNDLSDNCKIPGLLSPADVMEQAKSKITAALTNYLGFPPLDNTTREVAGSIFYPRTAAGVSPVVDCKVEVFEVSLDGFIASTPLDDWINTAPTAAAAPTTTDYQGRFVVSIRLKPGSFLWMVRLTKNGRTAVGPLIYIGITNEFLPVPVPLSWMECATVVPDYRREYLPDIPNPGGLSDALMRVIDEQLIRLHMLQIDHIEYLFIDHKHYIWQAEKKLLKEADFKQHVPLPQWQPAMEVPGDSTPGIGGSFFQVKMLNDFSIWGVNGIINPLYNTIPGELKPMIPMGLRPRSFDTFHTAMELAQHIGRSAASAPHSFHFFAHAVMGGPFANMMTAAAAMMFWPVHALIVDVYDHWVGKQFQGLRSFHLGNRRVGRPKHSHLDDHRHEHDDTKSRDYIEIFAISENKELWRVYERHVVYMRDDRPFDKQFDPAEILACNEPAWVHFTQWENLTVKKTNPSPMLHDHGGDGGGGKQKGEEKSSEKTSGKKAPSEKTKPSAAHAHGGGMDADNLHGAVPIVVAELPDVELVPDLHWPRKRPEPRGREVITEVLIDCQPVAIKTTTDMVTGRVIVLGMEEDGELCLLRPAAGDCNKCGDPAFTCIHLGVKAIDFDLVMKNDGTLEILFVQKDSFMFYVLRESAYNANDFDLNNNLLKKEFSRSGHAQVKAAKDNNGRVHALVSNLPPFRQKTDPSGAAADYDHGNAEPVMLHFFEKEDGEWTTAPDAFSKKCLCSFEVLVDHHNNLRVVAIDCDDGKIYACSESADAPAQSTTWQEVVHEDNKIVFFHLAAAFNGEEHAQLEIFALDNSGKCWRNKFSSASWAGWKEIDQIAIMERTHKDIFAQLDYTGEIKVFIHAASDNFIYMAEQQGKGGEEYLGWLNI